MKKFDLKNVVEKVKTTDYKKDRKSVGRERVF